MPLDTELLNAIRDIFDDALSDIRASIKEHEKNFAKINETLAVLCSHDQEYQAHIRNGVQEKIDRAIALERTKKIENTVGYITSIVVKVMELAIIGILTWIVAQMMHGRTP